MIAPTTSIAQRPHRVAFENPGPSVEDGRGGYTEGAPTTVAELFVRIQPAVGSDTERLAPGTVLSHGSYIVTAPYHPALTSVTRMRFNDRVFSIMGVTNRDERRAEMVIVCDELLP